MANKVPDTYPDPTAIRLEIELCEFGLRSQPGNLALVNTLAFAYTRAGEYDKGLLMDRLLCEAMPDDATTHYNLGCSLCLTGRLDEAADALLQAIALGYNDVKHLCADVDLEKLRAWPGFERVLKALNEL